MRPADEHIYAIALALAQHEERVWQTLTPAERERYLGLAVVAHREMQETGE